MKAFFQVLELISCLIAIGVMVYTYTHESRDKDITFDYHKSLYMRELSIMLLSLSLVFSCISNML